MDTPEINVQLLSIQKLNIDYNNYQREPVRSLVEKIKVKFTWDRFGILHVGVRVDGSYWVYDGQNRLTALRELGYNGLVPCNVIQSLGMEHEAKEFNEFNSDRASVSPSTKFWASAAYKDSKSLEIIAIAHKHGLQIYDKRFPEKGGIKCITSLSRIYDWYGADILDTTLRYLIIMFDTNPKAFIQDVVIGLAKSIVDISTNEDLSMERFVERVGQHDFETIFATAITKKRLTGCTAPVAFKAAFQDIYNKYIRIGSSIKRWET